MTEQQIMDAVKTGVKRARCVLVDARMDGAALEVRVKSPDADVVQIGREANISLWSQHELSERIRRFAEHYCLKRPYVLRWGDSLA